MRIVVLGAGVVGVTAAWYLAQDGHEVTVVDRQRAPALETSFANGGQISASYAEPWANPEAPVKILKWLGRRTRRCCSGCGSTRGSGAGDCSSCSSACRRARAATRSSA